jgi:histidine ammonia-lyase/phenylalanine ammonia-lyase
MQTQTKTLELNGRLTVQTLSDFTFQRESFEQVSVGENLRQKISRSYKALQDMISAGTPIYGVTTGFGDSCTRYVQEDHAEQLQKNLIQYLSCGQGKNIPPEASRAMFAIRLNSLSQGISGVSLELIERMSLLLKHDILPVVPCEGSLGASGDLVPLAYLGQTVQGYGDVHYRGKIQKAADVLASLNIPTYKLKPKEGLAIVNGTSTMAGMALVNLKHMNYLTSMCELATAWQCLILRGRLEAFGVFINEIAKTNDGQKKSAARIRGLLKDENYQPARGQEVSIQNGVTEDFVQDPYSIRCVPQIMGPIRENLEHSWQSLEHEINSVTDNPVVDNEGRLEMGGNFYGGYLCQSMDFIKINLAHMADLIDRQVLMIVSDKFNRGLPANLISKKHLDPSEYHIHHGLKGVHQTVGALTSEIIPKAVPNGIFSRSSESHNQDKVSLGMSAAMTCADMIDGVYKILAMQLVCLAQAADIKELQFQGSESQKIYSMIRAHVGFMDRDRSLGGEIADLIHAMKESAVKA